VDLSCLSDLAPRSVVFWSGAGISRDAPTGGPLGVELTKRVLAAYFEPGVYEDLQRRYRRLDIPDAQARPRLETVLDTAVGTYGLELLTDALSDLAAASPNAHHAFFAEHLAVGGRHITANFDTCIERAAAPGRLSATERPVHFHGALDGGTSRAELAALGGRLSVIENGLPEPMQDQLDAILANEYVQALVFIGYSGSDFFDAGPYLLQRGLRHLAGKVVAWLRWAPAAASNRSGSDASVGYLPQARAAGAHVIELVGSLDDLTGQLSRAWTLPTGQIGAAAGRQPWRPEIKATPGQRAQATAALYARMGFRQRTVEVLTAKTRLSPGEHELLADALWGTGRYRAAGRHWWQARSGDSPEALARRTERAVAVCWIRGQLLRAERAGWSAVDRFVRPDSEVSTAVQLEVLETYARILTHMSRLPDLRHRIKAGRKEHTAGLLTSLAGSVRGQEGIQLRAKVETATQNLQRSAEAGEHASAFAESEALHGWLNYTHGQLRHRAEDVPGHGQPYRVPVEDYLLLRRRFAELGAWGDVPRVALLPGAEEAVTPLDLWRDLSRVDLTGWHRIRLVGGFLARWLRSRQRCTTSAGPPLAP
jgi:hypothetical protein